MNVLTLYSFEKFGDWWGKKEIRRKICNETEFSLLFANVLEGNTKRRINQLVREIEGKAVAIRNTPPPDQSMEIDGVKPEISLPLNRPLFSPPQRPELKDDIMDAGTDDVPAEALFSQVYVDKEKLKDRIGYLLQSQDRITLSQIIGHFPLELGLSELITYLVIAAKARKRRFIPMNWRKYSGKMKQERDEQPSWLK